MTTNPIWPAEFPTGREPSEPELQPCWTPRQSYEGPDLDQVDLEAVEMRLMAFVLPRQCGKTAALKAMEEGSIADFYKAMGVPFEHLGRNRDA